MVYRTKLQTIDHKPRIKIDLVWLESIVSETRHGVFFKKEGSGKFEVGSPKIFYPQNCLAVSNSKIIDSYGMTSLGREVLYHQAPSSNN
jgi:hypothetical protein